MNESGSLSGAAPCGGLLEGLEAGNDVGSVYLGEVKIWKILNQPGDAAAGGIDLNRNGDGVSIVLNHEDDGQPGIRGGVERFPEFALRCGAFSDGDVGNFIAVEGHIAPGAVIAFVLLRRFGMAGEVASGL